MSPKVLWSLWYQNHVCTKTSITFSLYFPSLVWPLWNSFAPWQSSVLSLGDNSTSLHSLLCITATGYRRKDGFEFRISESHRLQESTAVGACIGGCPHRAEIGNREQNWNQGIGQSLQRLAFSNLFQSPGTSTETWGKGHSNPNHFITHMNCLIIWLLNMNPYEILIIWWVNVYLSVQGQLSEISLCHKWLPACEEPTWISDFSDITI